jgi:3-hydroxy-9,10-secoandrosta-1,3,5(10)-triene-9,17-dione monooxygenase
MNGSAAPTSTPASRGTQSSANFPTPEEFLARARALKVKVRERADESERLRRMPDATVADFLALELHRIMLPIRFGGCQYGWDVWCECLLELAQGDGSQAWAMMVHNEYVQLLGACSERLQEEVWGTNPRALISSSFQPVGKVERKDGGYMLSTISARWSFSSGIDEASWLIVGGMAPERGHTYFIVPRDVVTIVDDWYVAGLAGSGSKSFTIAETFVPDYRTITDQELNDGRGPGVRADSPAIYRYPRKAGAGLGIAAVPLGVAFGMLEDFKALARERVQGGRAPADQPTGLRISECAAELDAAKSVMLESAREFMRVLERGEAPTVEQRVHARRTAGYAALIAQRTSEKLYAAAGSAAIHLSSPLQRAFRDIHAGANHIGVSWETSASPFGEVSLGRPPPPGIW